MPNTNPRTINVNGMQYVFDQTRNKVLSVARVYLRAGIRSRNVSNQFMRLEDGQPAFTVGDRLIRPGTIVGLTANCESSSNWVFEIYRKGQVSPVATLSVISSTAAGDENLNVDVNEGDILLFKANGIGIPVPRGMLELAWRLP